MARLTAEQIQALDPYEFLAVLGKRVIHPGGRPSTDLLLEWAAIEPGHRVLDIGCGVGTTALRIARETGAEVVAADIAPLMRERAERNVRSARVRTVSVAEADIRAMSYPDASFDVVLAEAVTMFVGRRKAAAEMARVCKPGGRVLATEFYLRQPPTPEAREVFLSQLCSGMQFDSVDDWVSIYAGTGLTDVRTARGPFEMMTIRGFLGDEGWRAGEVGARAMSRLAYLRKMRWMMPRMARAVPYLGYILVDAVKPHVNAEVAAE